MLHTIVLEVIAETVKYVLPPEKCSLLLPPLIRSKIHTYFLMFIILCLRSPISIRRYFLLVIRKWLEYSTINTKTEVTFDNEDKRLLLLSTLVLRLSSAFYDNYLYISNWPQNMLLITSSLRQKQFPAKSLIFHGLQNRST